MYKYNHITKKQKEYIRYIMLDKKGSCLVEDVQNMSRNRASELINFLLDEEIETLVQQGVLKKNSDSLKVDLCCMVAELVANKDEDDPNRIRYAVYGSLDQWGWVDFRVATNGKLLHYEVIDRKRMKLIYSFLEEPSKDILNEFGVTIELLE